MFKICCFLALLTFVLSAPVDEHDHEVVPVQHKPLVDIVEQSSAHKPDGSYSFHFRGEDGSFREENAVVINPGTEDAYLEITGSYSFFDSDGKEVVVHYKADNHGFVPEGGNIPEEISVAAKQNSEIVPHEFETKKE
ncbi:larval cuticle protein 16/17 [Teleopsis dalmanni]|uniref:larval cuticle protein 16/17 n=1 Tax=Teleopsis dalmanni TaxID=139649 RepID=UPI0018CE70E0|nr:larval cuticle protein 16/17 [Teleopsis dalmanni]